MNFAPQYYYQVTIFESAVGSGPSDQNWKDELNENWIDEISENWIY